MSGWHYLSFADEEDFLGGAYVRGANEKDVLARAIVLGINPGGEVMVVGPLSDDALDANVSAADRERLLSRSELNVREAG